VIAASTGSIVGVVLGGGFAAGWTYVRVRNIRYVIRAHRYHKRLVGRTPARPDSPRRSSRLD
jgi:hypothetical protein